MGFGAFASAATAGLLSFFSPCVLPLLPVYVGILTTDAGESMSLGKRVANTVAFVLGISFVFVMLGLGAASFGAVTSNPYVNIALGLLIFVFGLYLAGVLRIPFLMRERRANMTNIKVKGVASAFVLGLAFSFGWTPCVGPILGSILALAADQGNVAAGGALLLTYSLGMCIPFVVITLASDFALRHLRKLNKYTPVIQKIGGALIAVMGLWMILNQVTGLVNANKAARVQSAQDDAALVADAQGTAKAGDADVSDVSTAWKNVVLTDLDGNKVRLSDYKGEPVYFEFWGSWCTSCVQDLGQLTKVYKEHEKKGDVKVVSVVVPGFYGERSPEDFAKWAKENDVQIPVLMDTNGSLSNYIGVSGFPTSVFITKEGDLHKVRVGAIDVKTLESLISEIAE